MIEFLGNGVKSKELYRTDSSVKKAFKLKGG
ncbi:hypothetical protein IGJ34_001989 [Enterococcus sp. AZ177]